MLFGISALGYWGLEIVEANTIPTVEDRYDWRTQKHICFGWMLFHRAGEILQSHTHHL